jgi:acyl-CoA reductase-like NAD-dependent aldehyde dehydrogenase
MVEVVQAFDRAHIADVPTDDASSLETKLETARRLFLDRGTWLQPHERMAVLHKVAGLVLEQREAFATLIAREGGKPYSDALVETDRAIDGIRDAADLLRSRGGTEIPMGLTPASESRRAWTVKEPIGVVAAISAFNHPLNLIVHQVAPAIATGCPIIIKPAMATPLCCIKLVELVQRAGLPQGWVQTLIPESRALSEALATDARIAFLSFIGSAAVGWRLRSMLAPGTRCALEHGGVAPVIIDRSADLDAVIEPIAKGGYYHAGQVCVSVQRIYVHAGLEQNFIDRLGARVRQLRVGDPTRADTEVGPLITPGEADRVESWIDEATKAGAQQIGGERLSRTTIQPAILVEPPRDAKVSTHEIFGPVTCVYGFGEIDEAIAAANALPVAFQASIFTRNLEIAFDAAERLDASAVMVNDHSAFRTDWMPFAGRRESGYGIGGIPYTAAEMTAEKMIVFKRT